MVCQSSGAFYGATSGGYSTGAVAGGAASYVGGFAGGAASGGAATAGFSGASTGISLSMGAGASGFTVIPTSSINLDDYTAYHANQIFGADGTILPPFVSALPEAIILIPDDALDASKLGPSLPQNIGDSQILLPNLSLIHISSPRDQRGSRMPSSA